MQLLSCLAAEFLTALILKIGLLRSKFYKCEQRFDMKTGTQHETVLIVRV
jgi:hypothetical protein